MLLLLRQNDQNRVDVASTVALASVIVVVDFVARLTNDTVWTSATKSVCSVGQIISGY